MPRTLDSASLSPLGPNLFLDRSARRNARGASPEALGSGSGPDGHRVRSSRFRACGTCSGSSNPHSSGAGSGRIRAGFELVEIKATVSDVFHPLVGEWFAARFPKPTEPQLGAWPLIHAGGDVLVAAPTGSGKTLAAFLICLDDLIER
ncbi:MAG: DEAD/DEAH box helicase, partial [Candidatus Eremiobacteraeota bacterium]|nr:DEAD/DEAH box helicase [Candidatus Eremiobacteraeota bacterium]